MKGKVMKKIGVILIIISFAMIAFYFIYNKSLEDKNNNDIIEYINETSVVQDEEKIVTTDETSNTQKESSNIAYTAVLEIPKIDLKRGVVDSTKNFNSINYAISVDNNSKYPDGNGNFILYSHSGNSNIAFFNKLYKVEINDDIYVYYNGTKYHYVVTDKYDIKKTGKASVIDSKVNKYITLITCNQQKDGYQIVVVGTLINETSY